MKTNRGRGPGATRGPGAGGQGPGTPTVRGWRAWFWRSHTPGNKAPAHTSAHPPSPRSLAPNLGSALLMVMWLSAALSAIGFALAGTVRGETERTATALEGLRAYYLAVGGVQRGMAELLWSAMYPGQRMLPKGATVVLYNFPSGVVRLEIIPEAARLDVNNAPLPDLVRLLVALGEPPGRAEEIAAAIEDWRHGSPGSLFDGFYLGQVPSFHAPHASFQEIEELLLVRGITRELFYGTYVPADANRAAEGGPRLIPRDGLINCLSVYGSGGRVDANTASPAVLAAVGLPPFAIAALVERRKTPLTEPQMYELMSSLGVGAERLRVEGNVIVTMRATAQLRTANGISDLKRTVGAQIKYFQPGGQAKLNVLRWYDTAWSN